MFKKLVLPELLLMFLIAMGMACSSPHSSNTSNSNSSAGQLVQTPLVSCSVTNVANNSTLMQVSNLTQASNYSVAPTAPASISINCSKSISASGGSVTVYLSVNGGVLTPLSGSVYSNIFANPGLNSFTIKVVDSSGNSSNASFSLPVACSPSSYSPIAMNIAGISMSQGSGGPGYVNVSVPAATGGSGQGFTYAIDINGDGRFDDYNQQYWNSSSSWSNMYTLYNGTRNVSVTAFDVGCNIEKTFVTPFNFTQVLPPIQTGATAAQTAYYYLQGQVDTTSGSTDQADTVHPFDAVEQAVGTPQHVLCSYTNGQFNITGGNTYNDGNVSSSEALLTQQMELGLTVTDNGAAGAFTQNNVAITNLVYQTAASPDGSYNQYTYQMSGSCLANVTVSRLSAVQPCASGQTGTMSPVTQIQGTYSCPVLNAPGVNGGAGRSIAITNGYFYCQVAPTNNCAGGGQGGGGQPPPQF